jgi:hypothetical protein
MGLDEKIVVKSQLQHEETAKIMTLHGCTKHFSFTEIGHGQ